MDMNDFANGRTPYEVLELSQGLDATLEEIKKAYKVLVLQKHPDKNRNNPNAAAEFDEVKKAYLQLTDEQARGAWDDYLRAKQARAAKLGQQSDKRRKMREELERREQQAASGRSEEAIARSRLQQELERLRKKMEDEAKQAAVATAAAAAAAAAEAAQKANGGGAAGDGGPSEDTKQQLRRTLKVTWDPSLRDYTSADLRAAFSVHGVVSDVVVRERKPSKSSSKGASGGGGRAKPSSALVVMGSIAEADAAAAAVNGDVSGPLLVTPLMKIAPDLQEAPASSPSTAAGGQARSGAPAAMDQPPQQPLFPATTFQPSASTAAMPAAPLFPQTQTLFPSASGSAATGGGGLGPQGPGSSGPASVTTGGFSSFPGFGSGAAGAVPVPLSSAEDAVLAKMRRVAERERQLAAAAAEADGAG